MTTTSLPPSPPGVPRPTPASPARRAVLLGGLGTFLTAAGASGWALDRYILDDVEVANASAQQATTVDVVQAAADGTKTEAGYTSDTATITLETIVTGSGQDQITYVVADVTVSDATILRSAFANDSFGQNIIADPSTIASGVGAVLAINGDYYGFRDTGIVIRDGVAYRDAGARQGLALYDDGTMRLYDETTTTAGALVADGVWQTLSFGPGLVDGGAVLDGIDSVEIDTNFGNHSVQGQQPRTAIGMIEANRFLLVVVDGRSAGYSRGMTMTELAQVFVDRGAQVAYNLDGGGSSVMVFQDELVTNPLGRGEERGTSDILYVAG